ncbi:MAG: GrrA/OscA1 family cyclophane-containing rSAM-modified RiPP [Reyranella sp.]|nr:GrrA/OscA1 family cyclophane-containing rSAM-modified RiPP [Reyranella sp.]
MSQDRRSLRALAQLLPSGAFGLSVGLAAADASATATAAPEQKANASVAERLQSLRTDVSSAIEQYRKDGEPFVAIDPEQTLAWWGNGWHRGWGWRNGGWGNGWHNGGWGNGGWGNGGWGNGWHNGWHNW